MLSRIARGDLSQRHHIVPQGALLSQAAKPTLSVFSQSYCILYDVWPARSGNLSVVATDSAVAAGWHLNAAQCISYRLSEHMITYIELYKLYNVILINVKLRCITGPRIDVHFQLCAWCGMLVPSGFYFAICAQFLWSSVSPWMPILTGIAAASAAILWLLTACTDPGPSNLMLIDIN